VFREREAGMNGLILATDIGSTTTKALLLDTTGGRLTPVDSGEEPTTVEKPHEDVAVGLYRALDGISRRTGVPLRDGRRFLVPCYATSSAGGGLQILVIALASRDSGTVARAVTCGAGGVVLDAFNIDDETPRVEKIQRMAGLSPDLVVLAGGYEDGALAAVVNMAQLLALASPRPKYRAETLPVVFCGNSKAGDFVREALGPGFRLFRTENIRPSGLELNLRPAIETVQRLFMDHVMQMAPGYHPIAESVSAPIIPTPAGVERILSLWCRETGEKALLADMGGATTDVFTAVAGGVARTVSANTGMSYSLSNILREAGLQGIIRHMPGVEPAPVRDRILEKTLFPTRAPGDDFALRVEHSCAAEGMALAYRQHLEFSYRRARVGFLDRLKLLGRCKFDQRFRTLDEKEGFSLSDFATIIGAGGVLAHAPGRRAAWILAQGFFPRGVSTLMVDSLFHSPHMGVLSSSCPEMALDYYRRHCLKTVCRVVTPAGSLRPGRPGIQVKGPRGGKMVMGGDFLYLEDGKGTSAGNWLETENVPLLVDCRTGPDQALPMDFDPRPAEITVVPASGKRPARFSEPGEILRTFSLPYPGEITVSPGETVEPGALLGRNPLSPPMIYFLDVRHSGEYDDSTPTGEILDGVLVAPGDVVNPGGPVYRRVVRHGLIREVHEVRSPVRGRVTGIVPPGLVRLREIQDYDGKPHVVDVAGPLGIKPGHIHRFLKVKKGDFVLQGQSLAEGGMFPMVKSPSAGTITKVDRESGTVTVHYRTVPVDLRSPVRGVVSGCVPEHSVTLSFHGSVLEGVLGIGRDAHGVFSAEPAPGALVLMKGDLTPEDLRRAVDSGAAAVISAGIPGELLSAYLGEDPGVILTGGEDVPVSLMAVCGAGSISFSAETWMRLEGFAGRRGALFTTTRIRAGVERPSLFMEE
jgi:hypothetical protein